MKKALIVFGLIVVILVAGAPFINGFVLEKIVHDSVGNINQTYAETGYDTKIEINTYDRGFSSSTIEWKLDLGAMSEFYGIKEIVFIETAKHGFTEVTSETSLEKNPWFKEFVDTKLGGKNPVHINSRYSLTGGIESVIKTDMFSVQDGEDLARVMPGQIRLWINKEMTKIDSQGSWDGAQVDEKFKLGKINFDYKMNKISAYIWDGSFNFDLDEVSGDDHGSVLDIRGVKGQYVMGVNDDNQTVSAQVQYSMDRFAENNIEYIQNGAITIGMSGLDIKGVEGIAKLYTSAINDAMKTKSQTGEKMTPREAEKLVMQQMSRAGSQAVGEAEKLLRKGLEIHIGNLKAKTPQGDINADVKLSLKKDMTMAQFMPVIMQPSILLDIFDLQSDIRIPLQMVGQNPNLLSPRFPGMQTGLFVIDGQYLTHKAQTIGKKLILNQKEVALP